ncbi:Uncharacterised protein [Klebsiella pneumoniae]|uniref:Uncharacterized protein n=1 Tax=Klebsiella pneumoniae TaxID=573 RepID=A0A377UWT1_KLEPN|nr:Uncharacterised protein [Klebsiella pneumoniae]
MNSGIQTKLDQIFRLDLSQQFPFARFVGLRFYRRAKTNAGAGFHTVGNHFVQASERAAADKQDLGGINLQELLLRMFTPALRRNGGNGPFDKLQQRLLHAFA